MGRVEGRVAIVTGGASGLGAATAKLLAEEGAKVLVTDIQEDLGRQVAADCGGVFMRHDTAVEDDWVQAFQKATAELGDVSILFNNAGVRPKTVPLEDTTLEDWQAHMAINMDGVFLGIKHAIRAMKEKGGAIVSTSSIYGIAGAAMIGAYSASKGGVRTLTKAAAIECSYLKYPIRINSIHPGFIETAMLQSTKQEFGASMIEKRMIGDTPMKRIGEAHDIAEGVLYLVADSGKFVTGIELPVDGGYLAK